MVLYITSQMEILQKKKKIEYFIFKLQTQEDNHDCVCYSPEKHQLFKNILQEQSQNMGAEINRYRGEKNLTINYYNSVMTQKLQNFEERTVELSYSDISTIMNECPLYDTVHLHGLLFKDHLRYKTIFCYKEVFDV